MFYNNVVVKGLQILENPFPLVRRYLDYLS